MTEIIVKKIAKLIDLKSIISLIVVIGSTVGFFKGMIEPQQYMTICISIITFYFAKNDKKDAEEEIKTNETGTL